MKKFDKILNAQRSPLMKADLFYEGETSENKENKVPSTN